MTKPDFRVPRPIMPTPTPRVSTPGLFGIGRDGLAPGSDGSTLKYLRADGAWAETPAVPVVTRSIQLTADHVIASATATKVAGLDMSLAVATYEFRYLLVCQSANVATGLAFGVNFTGGTTLLVAHRRYVSTGTLAATGLMEDAVSVATGSLLEGEAMRSASTTSPNLGPNLGVAAVDQDCLTIIEGVLVPADVGTLELWHASADANTTTVRAHSILTVIKAT